MLFCSSPLLQLSPAFWDYVKVSGLSKVPQIPIDVKLISDVFHGYISTNYPFCLTSTVSSSKLASMNRLDVETRCRVVACLVEGNSIRATVRMTGAAKNTVTKLLVDLGKVCGDYQDVALVDLPCTTIQCDEIWNFVAAKDKNIPAARQGQAGIGSVWTWTAICADTKLVPSW